jgi:hypothetical protein
MVDTLGFMSGRRARLERKALENSGRELGIIATAERMIAVDFSDVAATHTRQVLVGWMRHAFEQSRVIAQLNLAGLGHAAAPNRRSFFETLVRILWLDGIDQADRAGTVDAMLSEDKNNARKEVDALRAMGLDVDADLEEMESVVLNVTSVGRFKDQARVFLHAAQASEISTAGLYRGWRQETQYSHATAVLGGTYAPNYDDRIGSGRPPQADADLESLWLATALVAAMAMQLLKDEGVSMADELLTAFFA